MIQTHLILDKKTTLFKNLKKRGFLDFQDSIFILLNNKPSIGELIEINSYSTSNEEFKKFLSYRNKSIILRITDLSQTHFNLARDKMWLDILKLKCYEESADWI
jgi:hypothetical protein